MEEVKLSERESLELITTMIRRTRERYIEDGNIMLMWGYLTVGISALVWVMLVLTHNPAWNWLWFLIGIVGGILTPLMARRQKHTRNMKSYSDTISSRIWTMVGIFGIVATAICLIFSLTGVAHCWNSMFVFALIIVPFAEIAQGIVIKEKSLITGGSIGMTIGFFTVCCLTGDVPLRAIWFMPLFMVAFAAMMILPGHVLNHKAKMEK